MKADRELLVLAAKASGRNVIWKRGMHRGEPHEGLFDLSTGHVTSWNPLTDDGDALRLAVKLSMTICTDGELFVSAGFLFTNGPLVTQCIEESGCKESATRRAIVRAAAAIGEGMQ